MSFVASFVASLVCIVSFINSGLVCVVSFINSGFVLGLGVVIGVVIGSVIGSVIELLFIVVVLSIKSISITLSIGKLSKIPPSQ